MRGPSGWIKCECMRPTAAQKAAQRAVNSQGAKYPGRDGVRRKFNQPTLDEAVDTPTESLVVEAIAAAVQAAGGQVLDIKPTATLVRVEGKEVMIGVREVK